MGRVGCLSDDDPYLRSTTKFGRPKQGPPHGGEFCQAAGATEEAQCLALEKPDPAFDANQRLSSTQTLIVLLGSRCKGVCERGMLTWPLTSQSGGADAF